MPAFQSTANATDGIALIAASCQNPCFANRLAYVTPLVRVRNGPCYPPSRSYARYRAPSTSSVSPGMLSQRERVPVDHNHDMWALSPFLRTTKRSSCVSLWVRDMSFSRGVSRPSSANWKVPWCIATLISASRM